MNKIQCLLDQHSHVAEIMSSFEEAGFEIHLVGGAVRNALLDLPVDRFALTVNASNLEIEKTATGAGFKARLTKTPTGTVVVIHDGHHVEITPRQGKTLGQDALTRDFTVNLLYAKLDGTIEDPTDWGLVDLASRHVRFINTPVESIKADPIRILRFVRISVLIAGSVDDRSIAFTTVQMMAKFLTMVSPEEIGQEMRQILGGPAPVAAFQALSRAHLLPLLFPASEFLSRFEDHVSCLVASEMVLGLEPCFLRRLAVISDESVVKSMALSRREARRFRDLLHGIDEQMVPAQAGFYYGEALGLEISAVICALGVGGDIITGEDIASVRQGAASPMPLRFEDLPKGLDGRDIGDALTRAKRSWVASEFTADKPQLLADALSE